MLNIENNIKPYLMNILKHTSVLLIAILFLNGTLFGQESQRQRLERHVYTLAADSLQGRKAGSPDAARARAYIAKQWQEMGLKPAIGDSYEMPFDLFGQEGYCNLVALIEGSDPVLKDEYIVIGGHYDHLGVRNDEVYNGADDNASGTACVTEMARQLLARQGELKRSVIVCAFDAEEIGLYGSRALAKKMQEQNRLDRVQLMMSIDMVGWYKQGGHLTMEGTGTLRNGSSLTNPANLGINIKIKNKGFENSIFTATDTEPFAKQGIPTLAVTTGLKSPYHKPGDDANLIDYEGLSLVTDYLAAFVVRTANQPSPLASGKVATKHTNRNHCFEVGLQGGYNSSNITLPDAAFDTKALLGGQAGLMMQVNFNKYMGLHADVMYSYTRARFPYAADPFGEGCRLQQRSVTAPLTFHLGIAEEGIGVYLRIGGYYSRLLEGNFYAPKGDLPTTAPTFQADRPDHWGIACGAGFRLGNWQLDFLNLFQKDNLFDTSTGLPKAHYHTYNCSLGYYF